MDFCTFLVSLVQFNSLSDWVIRDMRGDSAEVLFQFFSFLQQACVSSSGMGRDAHSLVLSIQHILCWPRCHSPSEVPFRMVLDMLSWQLTCSNHASFCFLTAREDWSHYLSLNQMNKVSTCLNNHMILCGVVFSSGCLSIWGKMVNVRLFLLFFFETVYARSLKCSV